MVTSGRTIISEYNEKRREIIKSTIHHNPNKKKQKCLHVHISENVFECVLIAFVCDYVCMYKKVCVVTGY